MAKKQIDFGTVFSTGVLLSLDVRMWGATSKVPEEMLEGFSAEERDVIRAVHDLITDKSKLELLRTIKNESHNYIKRNSLPCPVREMSFLPKFKIAEIDSYLEAQKLRFFEIVDLFCEEIGELESLFAKKHPNLYRPEKYPTKVQLRSKFVFRHVFRMFDVPSETLSNVDPAIYNREMKKFEAEMEDMKNMIISEVGKEFLQRIDSFKEQCKNGNKINSRTITAINGVLEKFSTLWKDFTFDKELKKVVSEIREYMDGTDADMLRADDNFRQLIGKKMGQVSKSLEKLSEEKPKRALAL